MVSLTPEQQLTIARRLRQTLKEVATEMGCDTSKQPEVTGCFILWKFGKTKGATTVCGSITIMDILCALERIEREQAKTVEIPVE